MRILYILLLLTCSSFLYGQAYVQGEDKSGHTVATGSNLTKLETRADELNDSPLLGGFKVYSYADFALMEEYKSESKIYAADQISKLPSGQDSYLILMKKSSKEQMYRSFDIALQLPDVPEFNNLSDEDLLLMKKALEIRGNAALIAGSPDSYIQSELDIMREFKEMLDRVSNGESPVLNEMKLASLSFINYPNDITDIYSYSDDPVYRNSSIVDFTSIKTSAGEYVRNNADIAVPIGLEIGLNQKTIISDDQIKPGSALSNFERALEEFNSSNENFVMWVHLSVKPEGGLDIALKSKSDLSNQQFSKYLLGLAELHRSTDTEIIALSEEWNQLKNNSDNCEDCLGKCAISTQFTFKCCLLGCIGDNFESEESVIIELLGLTTQYQASVGLGVLDGLIGQVLPLVDLLTRIDDVKWKHITAASLFIANANADIMQNTPWWLDPLGLSQQVGDLNDFALRKLGWRQELNWETYLQAFSGIFNKMIHDAVFDNGVAKAGYIHGLIATEVVFTFFSAGTTIATKLGINSQKILAETIAAGKYMDDIIGLTKFLDGEGKQSIEVIQQLKKRFNVSRNTPLDELTLNQQFLKNLSDGDIAQLISDFGKYKELTLGQVKAWKAIFSKPNWRTNPDYLTKVSRYSDEGLEIVEETGELVVKQADGVKVGKLDVDNGTMKVKGQHSERHFDPDDAGGVIVKKTWDNPTFSQQGVDDINRHLSRFEADALPEQIANNNHMKNRMQQIQEGTLTPSPHDKRFYTHELEEYARYKNKGITDGEMPGPNNPDFHENAHTASLESYSIKEQDLPLYDPSVPHPDYVTGL